ncbi:protease [Rhizobium sp. RCAM05350]|nr:protease [Rhizobium sp. RCAM05350]
MANNTYVIDKLMKNGQTITVTDDGSGSDWLTIDSVYNTRTDIRLSWDNSNGVSQSASGSYFNSANVGSRLIVKGLIENVRGGNGLDFIQGNERANVLYGDKGATGAGGADILWGFDGNDTIYGGAGNDEISGGSGNDKLFGGSGNDSIAGGGGTDIIEGGTGADTLSGGADARDRVSYAGSAAGVKITLTYGTTTTGSGGDAQGDKIGGFADAQGSAYSDRITDGVSDTIAFGYNDNRFYGGGGNDTLSLGGGNDYGYGEAGNDTVVGGLGNDRLYGADGLDYLNGDSGNDVLDGGAGNDKFYGGAGADDLYGGAGADRFVFASSSQSTVSSTGRDTIFDFSGAGGDRIDLSSIDAKTTSLGNQGFTFIGTATFHGTAGELRYVKTSSDTYVYGDVNGDGTADFAIHLDDAVTMQGGYFTL